MSSQDQIDLLAEQARLKIQAQQKGTLANTSAAETGQEDIYADMRKEMEAPESFQPEYADNDFNIQHAPNDYEEQEMEDQDNEFSSLDTSAIFENGPSISQIELWKKQFSKDKVFHTVIMEKHYVFRTLNRYEYKQIVGIENIDALYREEIICKTCVLFPYNYDFKKMAAEPGGYPSTLAQIIMENSGFTKDYGIEIL